MKLVRNCRNGVKKIGKDATNRIGGRMNGDKYRDKSMEEGSGKRCEEHFESGTWHICSVPQLQISNVVTDKK
jgi:hypothetical protein